MKNTGTVNFIFFDIYSFIIDKNIVIKPEACSNKNSVFSSFTNISPTLKFNSLIFPETFTPSITTICTFADISIEQAKSE